jgi:hypothetical protein
MDRVINAAQQRLLTEAPSSEDSAAVRSEAIETVASSGFIEAIKAH